MAFPNTHAFAFAQIPRAMTKTWRKEYRSGDKVIDRVPNKNRHRHSAIARIQLSVEFDEIANFMANECERMDDECDDAIELWKENRNLWRDLELSVENQIDNYVKTIQQILTEQSNSAQYTFEAPTCAKTEIQRPDAPKIDETRLPGFRYPPIAPTVLTLPDDSRVGPSDSVSSMGESYIKRMIDDEITQAVRSANDRIKQDLESKRGGSHKAKKGSSQRKAKGNTAKSVLNYFST